MGRSKPRSRAIDGVVVERGGPEGDPTRATQGPRDVRSPGGGRSYRGIQREVRGGAIRVESRENATAP